MFATIRNKKIECSNPYFKGIIMATSYFQINVDDIQIVVNFDSCCEPKYSIAYDSDEEIPFSTSDEDFFMEILSENDNIFLTVKDNIIKIV